MILRSSEDYLGDYLTKSIRNSAILTKTELRKLHIVARVDAISLILTQNEGDQRMPLTGWIIAHRLYHALEEIGKHIGNAWDPKQNRRYPQINKRSQQIQRFVLIIMQMVRALGGFERTDILRIGTTRAGRDANLASAGELIPEAFAQYMLGGKIIFKPLPALKGVDPKRLNQLNAYINEMQGVLMTEFQSLIDYAKGKAFRL